MKSQVWKRGCVWQTRQMRVARKLQACGQRTSKWTEDAIV